MATEGEIVSGVTQKVLTHEVGAGAACLKCGDKCPGLDLHFWRKICRNCKCKQEDHDVLSSVSSRGINNIGKLLMQDREAAQKKPPSASDTNSKVAKSAAPPPAPKPTKQTTNTTPDQPVNGATAGDATGSLNVTIDIGGKKHTLDFGSNTTDQAMPPPPPPDSNADYGKAQENDFMLPPPPPVDDQLPNVPPLPEEFAEKAAVTETSQQKSPEKKDVTVTLQATPATIQSKTELPTSVTQAKAAGSSSSSDDEDMEYDWTPPVDNPKLISDYVQALPKEKQPIVGTDGAKYRKKQLMRQLPPHDQEPAECHDLSEQETKEMQLFVKQYREKALGGGIVQETGKVKSCSECKEVLKVGDVIVWAERAGAERYWHPACFSCAECKELLVDLIYFYHEDKIYCGRHYCELHKPRCAACDELIFAPEYTQAEDCYWHLKHFCCWHCDQPLGGKNYVPHDNQPVCIPCYEKSFAHTCSTCKEIIAPNTEWVTFEEHHWHAQPECFKCSQCEKSLVGKPCIPKGDMVFCCSQCKRAKIPPGQ